MKVVLNGCFGGFELSKEVKILYMEKLKEQKSMNDFKVVYLGRYDKTALVKNNITVSTVNELYKLSGEDCMMFNQCDIDRADPLLIECIEIIGLDKSSGECARLYIEDIPKGTLFKIDEYDGNESIEYRDNNDWMVAT